MWNLIRKYPLISWLVILVLVGIFTGLFSHILHRPDSIHQGAQADRASVAWNFAFVNPNFFEPRVMEIRQSDGVTGMEFPIIPYLVSIIYRIFGFNDAIYRGVVLLFSLWGLVGAYKLSEIFIKRILHRYLILTLVLTSPILHYYFTNYLPDPVALTMAIWGWYFFFKWYYGFNKSYNFNLMLCFFTLCALIKISFLMNWGVVLGLLIINKIGQRNPLLPWIETWKGWFLFSIPIFSSFAWYLYSRNLTMSTGNYHFLQTILPAENFDEFIDLIKSTINNWGNNFILSYLFPVLVIFWALGYKRMQGNIPILNYIIVLLMIFGAIFYLMFQKQFLHHDYYFIAFYPLILFLSFSVYLIYIGEDNVFSGLKSILSLAGLFILPFYSVGNTTHYLSERYRESSYWYQPSLRPYREYILLAERTNLHVPTSEKLIVAFDKTPASILYLSERRGVRIADDFDKTLVNQIIESGNYQYLLCNDSLEFNRKLYNKHLNLIAKYPNYGYYRIVKDSI